MRLRGLLARLWPFHSRERLPEADRPDRIPLTGDGRPTSEVGRTAQKYLVVAGLTILLVVLWLLRDLIILAFLAALIAAAMYGPASVLERFVPRLVAVGVAYLLIVSVVALSLIFIVPPVVEQATDLLRELPEIAETLRQQAVDVADVVGGPGAGERAVEAILPEIGVGDAPIIDIPVLVISILINAVLVFFLSALLLLERDAIRRWSLRFFVARDRRPMVELSKSALTKLGAYVRGQLVVMTITGIGTATGMFLLGVPFALPMGVLGFLVEAIPLAGPIILAVPVLLLAWLESPATAGLMLIWLAILQQLEGWVIYPVVQGRILSLSPAVVVLAVLAGASLYGVLGAIIALPVVAVADVVIRDIVFPLRRRASREDLATVTVPGTEGARGV